MIKFYIAQQIAHEGRGSTSQYSRNKAAYAMLYQMLDMYGHDGTKSRSSEGKLILRNDWYLPYGKNFNNRSFPPQNYATIDILNVKDNFFASIAGNLASEMLKHGIYQDLWSSFGFDSHMLSFIALLAYLSYYLIIIF